MFGCLMHVSLLKILKRKWTDLGFPWPACPHLFRLQIHSDMRGSVRKHLVQQHHNRGASLKQVISTNKFFRKSEMLQPQGWKAFLQNPLCSSDQTIWGVSASPHCVPYIFTKVFPASFKWQLFVPTRHPVALFLLFHTSSVALKHLAVVTKFLQKYSTPSSWECNTITD